MVFRQKIYEDYLKKSRLSEYRKVLECALKNGYKMLGILDFYKMILEDKQLGDIKIMLNRHDIDTSPRVAREMFEIEKEIYGQLGSATYYFRDSTVDNLLISEIEEYGYETGYHYEEVASYEKKRKLKNRDKIIHSLPAMRTGFEKDLRRFRTSTNSKSLSVASHGDFINTMYGLQSYELLSDFELRERNGIEVEAYDEKIMKYIQHRYADQILLERFSKEVIAGIESNTQFIMLLTHPRNWKVDFVSNTKENMRRMYEGIKYRI